MLTNRYNSIFYSATRIYCICLAISCILTSTSESFILRMSILSQLHSKAGQDLLSAGKLIYSCKPLVSDSLQSTDLALVKGAEYLMCSGEAFLEASRELEEDDWEEAVTNGLYAASAALRFSAAYFQEITDAGLYLIKSADSLEKICSVTGCVVMARISSSDYQNLADSLISTGECFQGSKRHREVFLQAGNALFLCGETLHAVADHFSR